MAKLTAKVYLRTDQNVFDSGNLPTNEEIKILIGAYIYDII
jgi:hypothetical protein